MPAAGSGAAALRPDWCTTLLGFLPAGHAQRVLADPAWPALVAAVTTGIRAGWTAADLLTAATSGLPEAVTADRADSGVAEALVFRVAALTDPAPIEAAEPLPADLQPPDDAHLLPTTVEDAALAVDVADLPPADEEPLPFDDEPPLAEPRYLTPDPSHSASPPETTRTTCSNSTSGPPPPSAATVSSSSTPRPPPSTPSTTPAPGLPATCVSG